MTSVNICLPDAAACIGSASLFPRVHGSCAVIVCRSARVSLVGDGLVQGRCCSWRGDQRGGRSGITSCVAPNTASVENVEEESAAKPENGEVEGNGAAAAEVELNAEEDSDSSEVSNAEVKLNAEALRRRRNQDWNKAESFKNRGGIFQGKVEAFNEGGLVLRFYSLRGFLPFSQLTLARLPRESSKSVTDIAKELIGTSLPVKVVEVERKNRRLVFSERKALWSQYESKLQPGGVFEGKVTGLVDYGAFVDIRLPDGSGTYPAVGLVHVKELAWDLVANPRDVLTVGQDVKVKIIGVDEANMKLALSIKQLQPDPLMETLDTLMPKASAVSTDSADSEEALLNTPLPGIEQICKELEKETGVTGVTLGRQAVEKHVVSQDLELWLSQTPVEDGHFTLLARAGRQVQEVHVTTSLDREKMKIAVKRVTQKIP